MRTIVASFIALVLSVSVAGSDGYAPVRESGEFMRIVEGRTLVLTRPGFLRPIQLKVNPNGSLGGEARGYPVEGSWRWEGNRFCRQMEWGGYEVGYSCQDVSLTGNELRFIADRGMFRTAYFRLQ